MREAEKGEGRGGRREEGEEGEGIGGRKGEEGEGKEERAVQGGESAQMAAKLFLCQASLLQDRTKRATGNFWLAQRYDSDFRRQRPVHHGLMSALGTS